MGEEEKGISKCNIKAYARDVQQLRTKMCLGL